MTNRVPSTPPNYDLTIINSSSELRRYDCLVLQTGSSSARQAGTYTVIFYGKIGGSFIPIGSYDLNIGSAVATPLPDFPYGLEALGSLFAFTNGLPPDYNVGVANYDTVFTNGHPSLGTKALFFVPIPSAVEPPPIGGLTPPSSGFLYDIWPLLDPPKEIKVQLICPDGTVLESAPITIARPLPDGPPSYVVHLPTGINIHTAFAFTGSGISESFLRIALFQWPPEYRPIEQAMLFIREDYSTFQVLERRLLNSPRILMLRADFSGGNYAAFVSTTDLSPGDYAIHVRFYSETIPWPVDQSYLYRFSIKDTDGPPSPDNIYPSPVRCRTETPAIFGEEWPYIVIGDNEIEARLENVTECKLDGYCSCFTFVPAIPENWVDVIGFFEGSILNRRVFTDASSPPPRHKVRLRGQIFRIDDEYFTESFVSPLYKEEDIVRSYSPRYQLEVIVQSPCDIWHIDILKLAKHWTVINRSNRMLPQEMRYLRPAEIALSDSGEHIKVTITLKPLRWRDEYRRQG
jgi:hypothetical protein